jgi:NitT/TauT family transport system permease protein
MRTRATPMSDLALARPAARAWRLPVPLGRAAPLVCILLALLIAWSVAATLVNNPARETDTADGQGLLGRLTPANWWEDRPVLPSPPQVAEATWAGVFGQPVTSRRSLVYHAAITMEAALAGFALGALFGIALAAAIVHVPLLDRGLLPWVIGSQAIPVVATAPMIIIIMGHLGLEGLLPKAVISASLAFFPVTVAMCKGLRAASPMQLDLMRTYNATGAQVFRKLRWPAAMSYLFPALKVAMALAITGAIVGELPTGAQAGLGARLLIASYNGLMLMMWATLVVAAVTAGLAVGVLALIERLLPPFGPAR